MISRPAAPTSPITPVNALVTPLWLGALALLLANDHALKHAGALPGWVTGKLSDFTGLLVAPALLATVLAVRSRGGVAAAHAATGLVFAALKLAPALAGAWVAAAALAGLEWRFVPDPTDLVALPMLAVSWLALEPRMRGGAPARSRDARARLGAIALGLFGCVATSRAPNSPPVMHGSHVVLDDYGTVQVFDARSGRRVTELSIAKLGPLPASFVALDGVDGFAHVDQDGRRSLVAFDLVRGSRRFVAPGAWAFASAEALRVDQRLVFGVEEREERTGSATRVAHRVTALRRDTGARTWSHAVKGPDEHSYFASLELAGGCVWFASSRRIVVLDAATGAVVARPQIGVEVRALASGDGRVVARDVEGVVRGFDAATGALAWSKPVGKGNEDAGRFGDESLAVERGVVVATAGNARRPAVVAVVALDAATGAERWRLEGAHLSAVGEGVAVVRASDSEPERVDVIDVASGRARFSLVGAYVVRPVLGDGLVVVRLAWDNGPAISAFELERGRRLWSVGDAEVRAVTR